MNLISNEKCAISFDYCHTVIGILIGIITWIGFQNNSNLIYDCLPNVKIPVFNFFIFNVKTQ